MRGFLFLLGMFDGLPCRVFLSSGRHRQSTVHTVSLLIGCSSLRRNVRRFFAPWLSAALSLHFVQSIWCVHASIVGSPHSPLILGRPPQTPMPRV